ncbi:MAG: hypothetical protein M3501_02680 [Actinomycetota bacterium]|nr:hypothetical protein [Actinomycetota bacterium]
MSGATWRALIAHPDVDKLCSTALANITSGRVSGCAHLDLHPVAAVCVIHPAVVRCVACAVAHIATHTDEEEELCDVCHRRPGDKAWDALAHLAEVDALVRIGRGRSAAVGIVALTGWAICASCRTAVER